MVGESQEWLALRPGTADVGGEPHIIAVVDCGELNLPSGRLVAADPFVNLSRENDYYAVPPGRYPVRVTMDETLEREMYLSLLINSAAEVRRAPLVPYRPDGERHPEPEPDEEYGVSVDAGTVCFVDGEAILRCMPEAETSWYLEVFDSGQPESWFNQMDAGEPLPEGLANITLPGAAQGENIVICHSGWGDGFYPVIGGYDAAGDLVAVHIDLLLHASIAEEAEEEEEE
ncbi:MAG TPA: DUF4241 domain-containing protein [Ktedonobacterales bacterium]